MDGTWSKAEELAGYSAQTREAELKLVRALKADPSRNPRLYRLVSVQRLEASGLTSAEIALELRITQRHVRRLARRSVSVALRKQIYKTTDRTRHSAVLEARVLVRDIRQRLAPSGVRLPQALGEGPTPGSLSSGHPRGSQARLDRKEAHAVRANPAANNGSHR